MAKNSLVRLSFVLTIANLISGILGYAYQIIMGRMLSPAEFASFSATISLVMFSSSPLNALFMVISRKVSSLRAREAHHGLQRLYWRCHFFVLIAILIICTLLWTESGSVQAWMGVKTESTLLIFFGIVASFAVMAINNAYFQGLHSFLWLGGSGILTSFLKIVFSSGLILVGFGVNGALSGIFLASIFIWVIGLIVISKRLLGWGSAEVVDGEGLSIKSIFSVLMANVAFSAMTQLDMVMVNFYFSSVEAGEYAAASILGKAILYLPGGLVYALFPLVAEKHARNQSTNHLLYQAVQLTIILCGLAAIFYWIFGQHLINLLYGPEYSKAGIILKWYGFAVLPMSLVMIAEYFLIARGQILFAWLFIGVAPIQMIAISLFHESFSDILIVMGVCSLVLAALGYGIISIQYFKKRNPKNLYLS